MKEIAANTAPPGETEREMIELFVRAASLVGLPRSLGEIYGLLYVSEEPLSMEHIIQQLQISTGSVSQGLRQLQSFRAVRTSYQTGERRNYYVAETEFRKVIRGFVQEEIQPHLDSAGDRMARIGTALTEEGNVARARFLQQRLHKLERLHKVSHRLIPMMLTLIKL